LPQPLYCSWVPIRPTGWRKKIPRLMMFIILKPVPGNTSAPGQRKKERNQTMLPMKNSTATMMIGIMTTTMLTVIIRLV
jgi:hypothetical protein